MCQSARRPIPRSNGDRQSYGGPEIDDRPTAGAGSKARGAPTSVNARFGGTVDRSIGSSDLVREIQRCGRKAFAFPDRGACSDMLVRLPRRGDRIVVMGARDDSLSQFAYELFRRLAVTIDEGSIATSDRTSARLTTLPL